MIFLRARWPTDVSISCLVVMCNVLGGLHFRVYVVVLFEPEVSYINEDFNEYIGGLQHFRLSC